MTAPPTPDDGLRRAAHLVASERSSPCPGEERILAFYAGSLAGPEEAALRDHLATCARCVELGRDARRFLAALQRTEAPPARSGRPWLLPLAASLMLLAAGVWSRRSWWPARPEPPPWQGATPHSPPVPPARSNPWLDFAVEKAAYDARAADDIVWRSAPEASSDPFAEAMEPYARADFRDAERRLGAYLAQRPGDERARFYRGVSLLLVHQAADAALLLEAAARARGPLGPEARWYLALARLKAGDEAAALAELRTVQRTSAAHRDEARALADRLAAAR